MFNQISKQKRPKRSLVTVDPVFRFSNGSINKTFSRNRQVGGLILMQHKRFEWDISLYCFCSEVTNLFLFFSNDVQRCFCESTYIPSFCILILIWRPSEQSKKYFWWLFEHFPEKLTFPFSKWGICQEVQSSEKTMTFAENRWRGRVL